jgi:hypothetical protein
MASISESEVTEFNQSVEYFIINCSKKIMYYHTDDIKEEGFDVNVWINTVLIDIYLDEILLPYNYTNFIKAESSNDDIIKSMNTEIQDGLEEYSFKSTFFRYCHFYAKNKLYEKLLNMTQEFIEEISSYSDNEDEYDN